MSAYANADLAIVKAYFTPGEMAIEEIGPSEDTECTALSSMNDDENLTLDTIVNIGKALWEIIQAGKATVDLKTDFANALPEGLKTASALHNWQDPIFKSFRFKFNNVLGLRVVQFNYKVSYTPGGRYNGKGHYLANVTVLPSKIKVKWGYKLFADVIVPKVTNVGSNEDPIAGMQLLLHWKILSIFTHEENTKAFYIRGDGGFIKDSLTPIL
jgi:hypothetical protein